MSYLKTAIRGALFVGILAGFVPWILLRWPLPTLPLGAGQRLGALLFFLGALISGGCAFQFVRCGRGTPAPFDPPREFVASGLYRYLRNPMYLGLGAMLLGEAVHFQSAALLGYFLLLALICHGAVVRLEEPQLRQRFGAVYEEYCRTVPRWWPRRPRKAP